MKNSAYQKIGASLLLGVIGLLCLALIGYVASSDYNPVDSFVMISASESSNISNFIHLVIEFVSYSL